MSSSLISALRLIPSFTEADRGRIIAVFEFGRILGCRGTAMKKTELKKFKAILTEKRDATTNSTGKKTHWENMENTRHGDFVDQASDDNEVHVNIRLLQTDAKLLRAIEAALSRIEDGSYGVCTMCGEDISVVRLKAVPWTSVCIKCKEKKTA
jgi:DnaK suppressor protein